MRGEADHSQKHLIASSARLGELFPARGRRAAASSRDLRRRRPERCCATAPGTPHPALRPKLAGLASGAQSPGRASTACPDALAEHMLHSPNSFLIHDISLGTIGASKQLLKNQNSHHSASEKGGSRLVHNVVSSFPREWAFGKPLSRGGPAVPHVRLTPTSPFPGAKIGHRDICHATELL